MFVSLLVANYNNGKFFKDWYQTMLKQDYTNWEVIIVDDASTDGSVEVIESVVKNDYRFKIFVNEKNMGCGFTKNKCAELAEGDIMGYVDPDDGLYENAVSTMVEAHENHSESALISSNFNIYDSSFKFLSNGNCGMQIPDGESFLTFGKGAVTAFATFKKEYYKKTSGIKKSLKRAVDQDLYFRLEEVGPIVYIEKTLYKYRQHSEGISQYDNVLKAEYWRIIAAKDAYNRRRKKKMRLPNFTKHDIKRMKANNYFKMALVAKTKGRYLNTFYFLSKSIFAYPEYQIKYKLKSILLKN